MNAKVEMDELMTKQRCYFMTLDPVHIGTGDYRLGRVDNTIVREPGSNLPKIPGTSLCGAARSYASQRYNEPKAAGRQHEMTDADKKNSFIVKVFGAATDTGGGQAGMVSISDARILFFPVYSLVGPVWVSTYQILNELEFKINVDVPVEDEVLVSGSFGTEKTQINLGWLLLKVKTQCTITPPSNWPCVKEWQAVQDHIVIVRDELFSQIVNSNLEVRTSVSISPITGAAEEGALFTYEAIPRATWLWSELIVHNYLRNLQSKPDQDPPQKVVLNGLEMIEYFGVGGMVTRGFGRMRLLSERGANDGDR